MGLFDLINFLFNYYCFYLLFFNCFFVIPFILFWNRNYLFLASRLNLLNILLFLRIKTVKRWNELFLLYNSVNWWLFFSFCWWTICLFLTNNRVYCSWMKRLRQCWWRKVFNLKRLCYSIIRIWTVTHLE